MPAKKKTSKKTTDEKQNQLLAMQGIALAIMGGVIIFAVVRLAQFRDQVDAMIAQQMLAPTAQQPIVK